MADERNHFDSLCETLPAYEKRSNEQKEFLLFLQSNEETKSLLSEAKVVASFGTGSGKTEIPLLMAHVPHLKKFYSIERCPKCTADCEHRFEATFPGIEKQFDAHLAQSWCVPEGDNAVDAIFMFHMLYYVWQRSRNEFLKRCINWLKPGGCILILIDDEGSLYDKFIAKFNLNIKNLGTAKVLKELEEFKEIVDVKEHKIAVQLDVSDPGVELVNFFCRNQNINPEEFREFLKEQAPAGTYDYGNGYIIVVKK